MVLHSNHGHCKREIEFELCERYKRQPLSEDVSIHTRVSLRL
jgi:hypothetical protein